MSLAPILSEGGGAYGYIQRIISVCDNALCSHYTGVICP